MAVADPLQKEKSTEETSGKHTRLGLHNHQPFPQCTKRRKEPRCYWPEKESWHRCSLNIPAGRAWTGLEPEAPSLHRPEETHSHSQATHWLGGLPAVRGHPACSNEKTSPRPSNHLEEGDMPPNHAKSRGSRMISLPPRGSGKLKENRMSGS